MSNIHLKRLAAPKTWHVNRKKIKFITKPAPGPHSLQNGIALGTLLKETLKYAYTTKEAKKMMHTDEIKVDGKARKDFRFPIGIFDTLEFTKTGECFRVILNKNGKIGVIKISREESIIKPCKIIGKKKIKGHLQLNLHDGKNVTVDKDTYKVGDTIILNLPGQEIGKHIKMDKKSAIFLIGGKHIGEVGNVEDIIQNKIIYKDQKNNNLIETSKEYSFVVGDSKPLIRLE